MKIQQLEEKLYDILCEIIDSEEFLDYQTTHVHEDYKLSAKKPASISYSQKQGFTQVSRPAVRHWGICIENCRGVCLQQSL